MEQDVHAKLMFLCEICIATPDQNIPQKQGSTMLLYFYYWVDNKSKLLQTIEKLIVGFKMNEQRLEVCIFAERKYVLTKVSLL